MPRTKKTFPRLQGDLVLGDSKRLSLTATQIDLLSAIDAGGSITRAAKAVGISYKTAWERIENLNNLAEQALVVRAAGGAKGGGTHLTDYGKQIVASFHTLHSEQQRYLQRLGESLGSLTDIDSLLQRTWVNTSARNQFRGTVTRVTPGAVNTEVEVQLNQRQIIIATITRDSAKNLQLKKGKSIVALIKASWVILSLDTNALSSARNKLVGVVKRVSKGAVQSDITVDIGEGKSLSATITNQSLTAMKIKKGMTICGLFKASSVILLAD